MRYRNDNGTCFAILGDGWHYDGFSVIEAMSDRELDFKIAQARYDDRWVTMQGNHVLIGGNERIKAGVGGRLKGRMFGMRFKDYENGKRLKNGKRAIRVYKSFNGKTKVVKGQGRQHIAGGSKADKNSPVQITKHEEIRSALRQAGFGTVDASFMTRVDKKLAVENTNQLLALEHKFGAVKATKVDVTTKKMSSIAAVASYTTNPASQTLHFSINYFGTSEKLISVNKSCHTKDASGQMFQMPHAEGKDSVYAVTHEYGHILQNTLIAKRFKADGWTAENSNQFIDKKGAAEFGANYDYYTPSLKKKLDYIYYKWYEDRRNEVLDNCYKEITAIAKKNNKKFKLKENLSKYGKKSKAEFFAEVFANSQLGAPNELGIAMQEWLKGQGLG